MLRAAASLLRRRGRQRSTVAVGMSGGVDSSVAALLLQQQGHDVVGVHMSNWDGSEDGLGHDCGERERKDAERVCRQLNIGFHEREYWHEVFTPFLKAYQDGGTPNPDLSCNRHIKFGHFAEHARQLGADRVATGHYARLRTEGDGRVQLLAALDQTKDQSYFLAAVRQEGLARTLFPLGALRKDRVRELAAEAGLHVAAKRDSVGICFVGKRDFGDFIGGYLPQAPGDFVCVETGAVLGRHRGVTQYTPGQRARLGGSPSKRYVVSKDVGTGTIVLCEGGGHPALRRRTLRAGPPLWVAGVAPEALLRGGELRCAARVRYQQPLAHCTVRSSEASSPMLDVTFDEPLRHVAEQQALVLYDGEVCFGAATIVSRGPSAYAEQQHQEQLQKHAEQQVARWRSSHSGAGAV